MLDSPASATIQGHIAAGEFPYDPDLAKQMLDEAGWTEGDGGVRQKDGVPLKFTINTDATYTLATDLRREVELLVTAQILSGEEVARCFQIAHESSFIPA